MKRKCYLVLSAVALNGFLGAPLFVAADVPSTSGSPSNEDEYQGKYAIRIQSITSTKGKTILTIGGEKFEVSPFSKISDSWIKGQRVDLTGSQDRLFPVTIKNVDNGETVNAKKLNRDPLQNPN